MTEFKAGDRVKVTRAFRTDEGKDHLMWSTDMEKYVGSEQVVTKTNECGHVQLDCGWWFYPFVLEHVSKSPVARILFEKMLVNGTECRKITGFEGISRKDELPKKYVNGRPAFWYDDANSSGAHVFDGGRMKWLYPRGSVSRIFMELPNSAEIDVGSYMFVGMSVGDIWPEATYQELLTWLKRAGSRLAKIRQQEREAWSGTGADEI